MNRCSQVIADVCAAELAKLINLSRPMRASDLTFNQSFKYLCLNDPAISVQITSCSEFEIMELAAGTVIADGPAISGARVADFLLGATRVQQQYDAVVKLNKAGAASAWVLVSAYYCAFFACLELAKVIGRFSMSFEAAELYTLRSKATGPHHAAFFAAGHSNFSGVLCAGKVQFQATGSRPHVAAWDNAKVALRQCLSGRAWIDATRFLELVESRNAAPSAIRNAWNYKRSDYYGALGERNATQFRKLIGNEVGAYQWMQNRKGPLADLEPCSIAVLCEGLAAPVLEASARSKNIVRSVVSA